jgi:hypothetical protein
MSQNPDELLATRIADELRNSQLILPESIEKFKQLLKTGTMKDTFWLNLLQKNIDAQNLKDETKITYPQ